MGRPTLKVGFNGAPMHSKVQGTALIAYLHGQFIQITGVEGRTYLVREGRLGEVVAVDAGKMLLVRPTAKRLPNTVDVNLSDFVKNSPMFNGGSNWRHRNSSPGRSRTTKEPLSKSTPIYFEGAGTEAVIAGGSPELPAAGEGLGDEGQPSALPLTGIDAIEQIPRRVEGRSPSPAARGLANERRFGRAAAGNGSPCGGTGINDSSGSGGDNGGRAAEGARHGSTGCAGGARFG